METLLRMVQQLMEAGLTEEEAIDAVSRLAVLSGWLEDETEAG